MHRFSAGPDLRMHGRDQDSGASLWPSFADIMTVVLMVFMLTMIVVIVRNANLVERIRLSQQLHAEAELRADTWAITRHKQGYGNR